MKFSKVAFFNKLGHPVNLGRQNLLAENLDYQLIESQKLFKSSLRKYESLLIADDIDISCLLNIVFEIFMLGNRNINLKIIFLELYTISFESLLNEVFWYANFDNFSLKQLLIQLYYTPKRLVRLIAFRYVLASKKCTIFLPSTLRINYVKSFLKKEHDYIRVRNLLFENSSKSIIENLRFNAYSYLFIAGNIYYLSDFEKVCEFAKKENIKIVVASKNCLDKRFSNKYSDILYQTGPLKHEEIIQLTKNCLAGIAVFCIDNINQKLAASSKLYEYAAYGKPIIVSRVPGVELEVKEFSINNVFYIDQLQSINLVDIPLIQTEFNFSYSYINEISTFSDTIK